MSVRARRAFVLIGPRDVPLAQAFCPTKVMDSTWISTFGEIVTHNFALLLAIGFT